MSSSESVWRILEFPIHERYPPVIHLSVHLENGHRVYFTEENAQEVAETPTDTTLTAYFKLNAEDAFARTLLYNEVPAFFTFDSKGNKFKRRQRGEPVNGHDDVRRSDVLGRVYTVHPRHAECYFLRLLLHNLLRCTQSRRWMYLCDKSRSMSASGSFAGRCALALDSVRSMRV